MSDCLRVALLPAEGGEAVDIESSDADRDEVHEDRLHPALDLQALARIGLGDELIPAPADFVAPKDGEDQRADGQAVCAYDEIPEVKPRRAFRKGLEGEHAVAEGSGQRQQENADAADNAALGTAPAGQLTHAGEDVLKHGKLCGEGGEDHEQEEQRAPEAAAGHVEEDGSHGVEEQRRAGARGDVIGKAGGEDDKARHDRHEGIQQDDVHGFTQQGAIFVNIAAKDRHGTDAERQGEERLVHGADDHLAVDLGEVGDEVEFQTFLCAVKGSAVERQNQHKREERNHHVLGNALQTALEVKAQHRETDRDGNGEVTYVDGGVGDHVDKAEIRGLADEELHEVVDHPAGDDRVEGHQGNIAQQADIAVDMPLLARLFQLLVHLDRAGLRRAAHGKFHGHGRKAEEQQAQHVHKHEAAAAVLTGHPRELPHVAAANGASCAEQNKAEAAAESFSLIIHFIHLSLRDNEDSINYLREKSIIMNAL